MFLMNSIIPYHTGPPYLNSLQNCLINPYYTYYATYSENLELRRRISFFCCRKNISMLFHKFFIFSEIIIYLSPFPTLCTFLLYLSFLYYFKWTICLIVLSDFFSVSQYRIIVLFLILISHSVTLSFQSFFSSQNF